MAQKYVVRYSYDAREAIRAIHGKDDRKRLIARLQALSAFPQMGVIYDPPYDAMIPRQDLLVTYAGKYGIYYTVNETERVVRVEHVENQRLNPASRFGGFPPREDY